MNFEDLAQVIFFVIVALFWAIGKVLEKKKASEPRRHRPVPLPEDVVRAPGPRHEEPAHHRRTRVEDLPSQSAPTSRRLESLRPKPLASTRRQGHDEALSDFGERRGLPSADAETAAAPPPPSPERRAAAFVVSDPALAAAAVVWREILGPPLAHRRR